MKSNSKKKRLDELLQLTKQYAYEILLEQNLEVLTIEEVLMTAIETAINDMSASGTQPPIGYVSIEDVMFPLNDGSHVVPYGEQGGSFLEEIDELDEPFD